MRLSKMQLNVKTSCAFILVNFLAFSTCQSPDDSEEAVALMTTVEPIDGDGSVSFKNASYGARAGGNASCMNITECSACHLRDCNWVHCDAFEEPHCTDGMKESCGPVPCIADLCTNFTTCQDCMGNSTNCTWMKCGGTNPSLCSPVLTETCHEVDCDAANVTTTAPDPSTSTTTTAPDNNSTTTETSTATTITTTNNPETTTTTDSPNETTTTTDEPVTPTTPTPVTLPTTTSTTSAPPPAPATGGFSAGSFFGGITLTLALLAVGYGGFRFYKTRYDVNYRTL